MVDAGRSIWYDSSMNFKSAFLSLYDRFFSTTRLDGEYAPRKWRVRPCIEWDERPDHKAIHVGIERNIVMWQGKCDKPRYVAGVTLAFSFLPSNWKIRQWHGYYDGEHCSYTVGPFTLYQDCWWYCKKCCGEGR